MKIYSASVLVINSDGLGNHYPLISGINRYSSCQDYLNMAVIPYVKQSPTATSKTEKVLINIVEGQILNDGSIMKTGGLDETLYF